MGNHYDLAVTCLVVGFDIQVLGRLTASRIYVFLDGGEARKLVWENVDGRPSIMVYAYSRPVSMRGNVYVVKGSVWTEGAGQLGGGTGWWLVAGTGRGSGLHLRSKTRQGPGPL